MKSLRKRVKSLEQDINNESWYGSTKSRLNDGAKRLAKLEQEVSVLKDIIKTSGIVEDIDLSDVRYRTEISYAGVFGFPVEQKIPYVINEVKTKG